VGNASVRAHADKLDLLCRIGQFENAGLFGYNVSCEGNGMRLEDFENWDTEKLRQIINGCFEHAEEIEGDDRRVVMLEAEFYVRELDRRENRRAEKERRDADTKRDEIETKRRRVDLGIELLIVGLIGLELFAAVGLAIRGSRQQAQDVRQELAAFSNMQTVLSNLEQTSEKTSETMKSEGQTMEVMSYSLQRQVALFYDVQTNVVYNESTKKLILINSGRANITVWAQKIGLATAPLLHYPKAVVIPPNGTYEAPMDDLLRAEQGELPKGTVGGLGFTYLVKNEKSEKFTVSGDIYAVWKEDKISLNVQPNGIVPGWKK